nr:sigma factor-like helix-turn-helix DNA-binding protein [Kibdelosporangium sp. MJ126-NF4]CEL20961.1 RNA polymerase sigma-70 factor [Kibdelosporangium sp. MJ126-NF4]CTQ95525.1 RNA polymerase sigma-70 factor [Kibdelosporangium sp. MJ126-NF4]
MSLGSIVLETIKPVVVRYTRARIGRRDGSFAVADLVARESLYAVMRALPEGHEPLLAVTYRVVAEMVNKELDGAPGCHDAQLDVAALPEGEREVIVLRALCGLTAEQTAEAIGTGAVEVRLAQHLALEKLRNAAQVDRHVTRFGHGAVMETLSERR